MLREHGARCWIECVPNISEGRRAEAIREIAAEVSVHGARLLHVASDKDHNRTVVTFAGTAETVEKAALALAKKTIERVDLNKHKGEHPRAGAVDVVPFVPLFDTPMAVCVELAHRFGKKLAAEVGVPVYFYEHAALRESRRKLETIRNIGFEKLRESVSSRKDLKPDVGPSALHPTAGATFVGARAPLIAFNVNLDCNDVRVAKNIARAVRHSSGGLRGVKALGLQLKGTGKVQVSMNLVDYKRTPVSRVFELIRAEARRYGARVAGAEFVGLVPIDALLEVAGYYLGIPELPKEQVLEYMVLRE